MYRYGGSKIVLDKAITSFEIVCVSKEMFIIADQRRKGYKVGFAYQSVEVYPLRHLSNGNDGKPPR
jgi:hypothetical protein